MYESRFVTEPFYESVDGINSQFSDIEFITAVKHFTEIRGIPLTSMEAFISRNEGWFGVYGNFGAPSDVVDEYQRQATHVSKIVAVARYNELKKLKAAVTEAKQSFNIKFKESLCPFELRNSIYDCPDCDDPPTLYFMNGFEILCLKGYSWCAFNTITSESCEILLADIGAEFTLIELIDKLIYKASGFHIEIWSDASHKLAERWLEETQVYYPTKRALLSLKRENISDSLDKCPTSGDYSPLTRRDGEIGRRTGLKILQSKDYTGSIPVPGTKYS